LGTAKDDSSSARSRSGLNLLVAHRNEGGVLTVGWRTGDTSIESGEVNVTFPFSSAKEAQEEREDAQTARDDPQETKQPQKTFW